jgi:hypothetical protein
LQIRLASGAQPLTTTLPSDASSVSHFLSYEGFRLLIAPALALREVAEFVAGQTLTVDVDTVTFTQQFPRYLLFHLFCPISALLMPMSKGNNSLRQISPGLSVIWG